VARAHPTQQALGARGCADAQAPRRASDIYLRADGKYRWPRPTVHATFSNSLRRRMVAVRVLKFIAIALGSIVVLLVLVLLAARLLINPNDYKDRIAGAVKASTGRELALPGDIRLSVFPWVALELGPASLGNPPGFGAEPFAAVKHAALRVRLLPLLRKQLQIGRVDIDGLDLRLLRNAAGQGNWQGLGTAAPSPAPAQGAGAGAGAGAEALRDLAGVSISNSRVSYQSLVLEQVNLEVGHVTPGAAAPVKLRFDLAAGPRTIALAGSFDLTPDLAKSQYRFTRLQLEGTLSPKAGAARLPWSFSTPELDLDAAAQTVRAADFAAQLGAAHLTGGLQGSRILDAPSLAASFKLAPLSPRELLAQLGITLPKTRDPKAFSSLAAAGGLAYGANAVRASGLDVRLDDSVLHGSAALTNLDTQAISFDLSLDRIDLDRYRSPEQTAPAATPAQLPTEALKALQLNGALTVGSATLAGVKLAQLHVGVAAKGGVTHIAPATAKLYGGDYTGDITLDDRGAIPAMSLNQSMTGVDVSQLARDFMKSQRLSGRGTITSSLTTRGRTSDELLKTLSGHAAATIDNGAVEGFDLWFEINRALSLIQKQSLASGQSSGRTRFDSFKASAEISNGVATTRDLNVSSQNLRVTGQGTANLVTEAVAMQLKATILKGAAGGAAAGTLADIPLSITGTLTSPTVRPDLQALAKAGVQQQIEKHKQELQQKLQNQLQQMLKIK
jgi:AsmA protein